MEALQTLSQNSRRQDTVLKIIQPSKTDATDRPGWIPPEITHDWDPSPYAYQTEEEMMPGGGPHGRLLAYIMAILQDFIETRGMMLLMDAFMLYRDDQGVKQRISPDLLLMPFRSEVPSAYDLDFEPLPLFVAEITSPESHTKDLKNNVVLYTGLGIPTYLAIDPITPQKVRREQIGLYLWRNIEGRVRQISPNANGFLALPEMQVAIKAQKQNLVFTDIATGELLKDATQLRQQTELAEQYYEMERQRAEAERQRAEEAEKQLRSERQRAAQLAKKLRELGVFPE